MSAWRVFALLRLLVSAACGFPPAPQESDTEADPAVEETPSSWFTEITAQTRLDFHHSAGAGEGYLMTEIMGSGAALFDYDGDGDLDVYLVDGGGAGTAGTPNRMFRRQADGTFADETAASGLGDPGYGMGVALGDVDNDGDLDVFVTNVGTDALYLNAGDGSFEPSVAAGAIGDPRWSTSACFFDADRDGMLDLYVATYVDFDPPRACTDRAGNPEYCGPEAFRGLPDRFFRGRGDGTFEDVSGGALAGQPANKGLGVFCADFDGDSWVDVYVANDGEANQLWINLGPGAGEAVAFEDRAPAMGAALNAFGKPEASMGVAAGDVDADGDLDLFMTHLDRETSTLYLNLGASGFEDRSGVSGLGPPSLSLTGFGTVLFDGDLDGDLDLAVVDGRVRRGASPAERAARREAWRVAEEVPPRLADYAEPNLLFTNEGDLRFTDASALGGRLTSTSAVEVGRALLAGDFDDDGDLDLLATTCGGPARLYRNDSPRRVGSWLRVRAVDSALRRDALGAMVEVRAGGRRWVRPIVSAQSYLAAAEPEAHFGLGDATRVEGIAVSWPDGAKELFPGCEARRTVVLRKGEGVSE